MFYLSYTVRHVAESFSKQHHLADHVSADRFHSVTLAPDLCRLVAEAKHQRQTPANALARDMGGHTASTSNGPGHAAPPPHGPYRSEKHARWQFSRPPPRI